MRAVLRMMRDLLLGPKLAQAIERNHQAADRLDNLVREVLNR